jgi:hypothetical protein
MPIRQVLPPAKAALFNKFGRGIVHMGLFDSEPVPEEVFLMRPIISTFSKEIFGLEAGVVSAVAMDSGAVGTANRIFILPLILEHDFLVTAFFVVNGATVSGLIDMGIYSAEGWRLFSTGTTFQTGTSVKQTLQITAQMLNKGAYYLALGFASASATVRGKLAASAADLAGIGMLIQDGTMPLPGRLSPIANLSTRLPLCGIQGTPLL